MVTRTARKRRLWSLAFPATCLALVFYFGYFGLYGEHGLLSLIRVTAEKSVREAELARLVAGRESLAHNVISMRAESIDPDLLDEEARSALGYSAPGEITFFDSQW
ncbi:MAG: septum formation initiator family protein [Alphaproteobacteria bacterium]|nr:septum formation initiator family protein [Alphaproteobacteria bacterium]